MNTVLTIILCSALALALGSIMAIVRSIFITITDNSPFGEGQGDIQ